MFSLSTKAPFLNLLSIKSIHVPARYLLTTPVPNIHRLTSGLFRSFCPKGQIIMVLIMSRPIILYELQKNISLYAETMLVKIDLYCATTCLERRAKFIIQKWVNVYLYCVRSIYWHRSKSYENDLCSGYWDDTKIRTASLFLTNLWITRSFILQCAIDLSSNKNNAYIRCICYSRWYELKPFRIHLYAKPMQNVYWADARWYHCLWVLLLLHLGIHSNNASEKL